MKKFIAIALLTLFATACTPTENAGMMKTGMQCSCCKGMMDGMEAKKQSKVSTPTDHTAHH